MYTNIEKLKEELEKTDKRLEELRQNWRFASLIQKRFIEAGAKLLKDKKLDLEKQIENLETL